jgi:hypothetical protein
MMVQDWAHAAFEAARRHDADGVVGVLTELAGQGRPAMEVAMRLWMDRVTLVMWAAGEETGRDVHLALEMEADSTGELSDVDQLPAEVAWAGRLVVAHRAGDERMWDALMSAVPPTTDGLIGHVTTLLRTVIIPTVDAYAEQCHPRLCCPGHAVDVETLAARVAVSHLN